MQFDEQDPYYGKTVAQGHGNRYIVQNSPALPLTQEEMDHVYSLPYTRKWHPMYAIIFFFVTNSPSTKHTIRVI